MNREKISLALKSCKDFSCSNCPYQKYEDIDFSLKCIHLLMVDLYNFLKGEGYYE